MAITFGVSTWLWTSPFATETVSLFSKIKAMGYDAVEIPVEDPTLIDAARVKEALEAHGLKALVCGAFGPTRDLTHDDPAVHETCLRYLDDCFALCQTWGAPFLAGPAYSAVGKARMVPAEQKKREWDRAVTNLQRACARAAQHGVSLALEPLNRFESDLINTADDVMRLVGDINHPAAGVALDGFHMNIEEPDIEQAIRRAGDRLLHVQVSENYRGTPGTGQTRWDAYQRGLRAVGYQGVISIESFTPKVQELAGAVCIWRNLVPDQDDFAADGLTFLKQTFSFV
ncbi:D-psicose/D-tagatose/L-ribulose 3-epimerase [Catalinimonas alkaloidigena]|uniref:D-psicose/D-tagatose/L-ribulose 3-epimerase n=1 Tax=Catalinimonas alkaloidigena TaxID=1075417 RepID=A0A1G9TL51_9BACT|nr:sugar phosphate isomerase/epimerase family protein [Catalinimonas alkaloidigena]SDM48447.1 D-psicose/D-tagatose/L-ribulose 3-epimerase [Catalinimonas alkaloidigena]